MTTTPWAVGFEPRYDKKCGNSAIPDNRQCRLATGGRIRRGLENAAIVGGTAGQLAGLGATVYNISKGRFKQAARASQLGVLSQGIAGGGLISRGKLTGNKKLVEEGKGALGTALAFGTAQEALMGKHGMYRNAAGAVGRAVGRGASRVGSAARDLRTRASTVGYQRRSGPPRHTGYLSGGTAEAFRPRGRGRRGTNSWDG